MHTPHSIPPPSTFILSFAWLPIPLLLAVIVALWAIDLHGGAYESPYLLVALNFVFSTMISLFIAYLVARSFLIRGTPGLLMLGCGVLAWGFAGFLGGIAAQGDINVLITIHNSGVLLSAVCHLMGAVLSLRPGPVPRIAGLRLAAAYAAVLCALGLIAIFALARWTPVFFVQGHGGTPLRQFVLGAAIAMFLVTAVLLRVAHRKSPSAFVYWYALALGLLAIGLFGVMIQASAGSLLGWTGRAIQYLGGVYMLIAAITSVRESHVWEISLAAAMRETEERFQVLASATFEGIAITEDGRLVDCNEQFLAMLGRPREEVIGRDVGAFIPAEAQARATANIRGGREAINEHAVIRRDGANLIVEAHGRTLDYGGRKLRITAIRDISDRKRAEARLTADLAALTRMHALSGRLVEAEGLQPLLQEIMDAAAEIVGAQQGTLQLLDGNSLRIVAHHGHRQPFLDFFASAENRASVCGEATTPGERVVIPDVEKSSLFVGTPSLAVLREAGVRAAQSTPMRSRTGTLLGILTTQWGVPHSPDEHDLWRIDLLVRQAADLIEYAQVEESLRQSKLFLQETERIARVGGWKANPRIDYLDWSEEVFRIIEAPLDYQPGVTEGLQFFLPEYRAIVREAISRCLDSGEPFRLECEVVTTTGQRLWTELRGLARLVEGKRSYVIGTFQDITERKQAEEQLRRANAELEQKNAEMEQLVYTVSHDLKSPLVTIQGFLGHLLHDAESGRLDRLADHGRRIQKATGRMARLLDELLDISRIGRIANEPTPINLTDLAREVVAAHAETLAEGKINVDIQADMPVILGDRERIHQVFDNLLVNAIKYGSSAAQPRIGFGAEQVGDEIRAFVKDNGKGISPGFHDKVFKLFHRLDQDKDGIGAGLAIVKRIVEVHGGRVWVESPPGEGAAICMALPAAGGTPR